MIVLFVRLRDISEEVVAQQAPRRRSNSLPIPKIEVSLHQATSCDIKKRESKDFMEVPEVKDVSLLAGIFAADPVINPSTFPLTEIITKPP